MYWFIVQHCILSQLIWILLSIFSESVGKSTYFLSQDCQPVEGLNTKRLYFELTGAVIYSHPRYAQIFDRLQHSKQASVQTSLPIHSAVTLSRYINSAPVQAPEVDYLLQGQKNLITDEYPVNFSCEVFIKAELNSRIMLRFQSLYIPSTRPICDDNYLYVFDSNTPQYKAMVEAGGEKGLCQRHFPEEPIFTTKSVITIVFRSTTASPMETGKEPGFKLTLTATQSASPPGVCPENGFFCGQRPSARVNKQYLLKEKLDTLEILAPLPSVNKPPRHVKHLKTNTGPTYLNASARSRFKFKHDNKLESDADEHSDELKWTELSRKKRGQPREGPGLGYCIPKSLQCDGIVHCHNARDELPSLRMDSSHLPAHLLRALVGAHLVPADLKNVGCTRYKMESDPSISPNLQNQIRPVKFEGPATAKWVTGNKSDTSLPKVQPMAVSYALTIGCIGISIFVVIAGACSIYQCCYRHKFHGQHFLIRTNATKNTTLVLQGSRSSCRHRHKQFRFSSATESIPRDPSVLSSVVDGSRIKRSYSGHGRGVKRSVTHSTLISTVESYPTSSGRLEGNIENSRSASYKPNHVTLLVQQQRLTENSADNIFLNHKIATHQGPGRQPLTPPNAPDGMQPQKSMHTTSYPFQALQQNAAFKTQQECEVYLKGCPEPYPFVSPMSASTSFGDNTNKAPLVPPANIQNCNITGLHLAVPGQNPAYWYPQLCQPPCSPTNLIGGETNHLCSVTQQLPQQKFCTDHQSNINNATAEGAPFGQSEQSSQAPPPPPPYPINMKIVDARMLQAHQYVNQTQIVRPQLVHPLEGSQSDLQYFESYSGDPRVPSNPNPFHIVKECRKHGTTLLPNAQPGSPDQKTKLAPDPYGLTTQPSNLYTDFFEPGGIYSPEGGQRSQIPYEPRPTEDGYNPTEPLRVERRKRGHKARYRRYRIYSDSGFRRDDPCQHRIVDLSVMGAGSKSHRRYPAGLKQIYRRSSITKHHRRNRSRMQYEVDEQPKETQEQKKSLVPVSSRTQAIQTVHSQITSTMDHAGVWIDIPKSVSTVGSSEAAEQTIVSLSSYQSDSNLPIEPMMSNCGVNVFHNSYDHAKNRSFSASDLVFIQEHQLI